VHPIDESPSSKPPQGKSIDCRTWRGDAIEPERSQLKTAWTPDAWTLGSAPMPFSVAEDSHCIPPVEAMHERRAYEVCVATADELVTIVGQALNGVHGVAHSDRYWRLLLWPWLYFYSSAVYAHVSLAESPCADAALACERLPLHPEPPSDTLTALDLLASDSYQATLVRDIAHVMGLSDPDSSLSEPSPPDSRDPGQRNHLRLAGLGARLSALVAALLLRNARVVTRLTYADRRSRTSILLRSAFSIVDDVRTLSVRRIPTVDAKMRLQLAQQVPGGSTAMTRLVAALVPAALPRCYLEGHSLLVAEARQAYPDSPEEIVSAIGWYFDEVFKQFAAAAAETGTRLVGVQHGGGYGWYQMHAHEYFERTSCDEFMSWGWEDDGGGIRAMPALKLVRAQRLARRRRMAPSPPCRILVGLTSETRYCVDYPWTPKRYAEQLNRLSAFLDCLGPTLHPQVALRLRFADYGWHTQERLAERHPWVAFESANDVPFLTSLATCSLYIVDHLSTTILESMSANVPTVAFTGPDTPQLRPECIDAFDALGRCGVLHHDPKELALFLDAHNGRYADWWESSPTQAAVQEFKHRYARSSPRAAAEWTAALLDGVNQVRPKRHP